MTSAYICEMGGCDSPRKKCANCGFESHEAYRRSMIPLTLCEDGLKRKILRREDDEGTEATSTLCTD